MGELPDAAENYGFAAEKYELIQQLTLSRLMKIKATQCKDGADVAVKEFDALLLELDPEHKAAELTDAKGKAAIARVYNARAQAILDQEEGDLKKALEDATYAAQIGWDRSHIALYTIGQVKDRLEDFGGAIESYSKAITANPKYLDPHLAIAEVVKTENPQRALEFYTSAIEVHPRSSIIRDKAYLMSELKDDAGALALLDTMLADPPIEEGEGIGEKGSTEATLYKAKAAILADLGRLEEALVAAEAAVKKMPNDEEAIQMVADIKSSSTEATA
eukprot:GILJ01019415.1.p1 GENE.GILJ01019415.1~~GILJ01019415.1.p1  ORF type:complete len:316 (-),score=74.40 GILJ01019415.1:155-982(-)